MSPWDAREEHESLVSGVAPYSVRIEVQPCPRCDPATAIYPWPVLPRVKTSRLDPLKDVAIMSFDHFEVIIA
jgi:hypothetical protein